MLARESGGPPAEWAERIVGWYEARWGIEDRQLHEAEALQQCLAFDAVTAWRVFSLDRYARDEPETLAAEVLTEGEREVIGIVVRAERLLPPSERDRPFQPDIRSWVILMGRMAGWHPSNRRPLPGNEVLWRAYVQMQGLV